MAYDGTPDTLWYIRMALAQTVRRAERAGYEGALDPAWTDRLVEAIGCALSECDLARAAGAVLQLRPPLAGESVEVSGAPIPDPLPTERSRASEASWLGRR